MRQLDGITDSRDEQALGWSWTWKPGMLQSMELPRVGHDWATELNSQKRKKKTPKRKEKNHMHYYFDKN